MNHLQKILLVCVFIVCATATSKGQENNSQDQTNQQYQKVLNDLLVTNQLFTANNGQWDPNIAYQSVGQNASAAFYSDKVAFSMSRNIRPTDNDDKPFEVAGSFMNWSISFENSQTKRILPNQKVDRNINYFGPNSPNGTHFSEYKELLYKDIYPNTDLKFYGSQNGELKYDFIVKRGGDINEISMRYDGVEGVKVLPSGELSLRTAWGSFKEDKPYSYQLINGKKIEVQVVYEIRNGNVGFKLNGPFNKNYDLIIDPIYVDWSTYFYGETTGATTWGYTWVLDVDIDDEDNVYVSGMAYNQKFYSKLGGYDTSVNGYSDAYVCKISAKGDSLLFFSYFGGSNYEYAMNVSVGGSKEVVVSGITYGGGFPTTSGAFDEDGKSCSGGYCWQGFVTKFSKTGQSLIYSTYLTGNTSGAGFYNIDWIRGMQVDDKGKVYLVGNTTSEDFPTTTGCYQSKYGGDGSTTAGWYSRGDGFLSCLSSDGTSLVYSTYIGGDGYDVARDVFVTNTDDVYVVGQTNSGNFKTTPGAPVFNRFIKGNTDAFVIKFESGGSKWAYAKLMGGSGDESFESIYANSEGDPYIVGNSNSSDFPVSKDAFQKSNGGGYDMVVVKLISAGTNFYYSTYLGGGGDDAYGYNNWYFENASITANVKEQAIIAATTKSNNFPITSDALQKVNNSSFYYGKLSISKISFDGKKVLYGTYFGGSGGEFPGGIKAKRVGCVTYILSGGNSYSGNYPTTAGTYRDTIASSGTYWNGFITKFRDTLFTETIDLGLADTLTECDQVFEIFDGRNQGADFMWSDGSTNRYNITKDSGLIWVQATYGCDTVRDSIQIVLEHSPKIPVLMPDSTFCDNFPSITLDAKNDTILRSYRWHDGSDKQTLTVSTPGKYYVDISTPNCGTKTDTVRFKLLDTPELDLVTDSTACDSVRLVLDAENTNNEVKYNWSTLDSVQSISVLDTGLYWVTVQNYCGFDSNSVYINKLLSPVIQLPEDSVFCNTVNYTLKIGTPGNDEYYDWEDIDNQISLNTSDSLNITAPMRVRALISNYCGTAEDSISITQIVSPVGMPKDTVYECDVVNEDLTLTSAIDQNQEIYSWSVANKTTKSINVTQAGNYMGYISNKCGIDSASWTIILKNTPTVNLPKDTTFCNTISASLDVSSTDPEMIYEWQDNSNLPTYAVSAPGTYKVILTNRCGNASDEITYDLLFDPKVNLGKDKVFCDKVSPQTFTVGQTQNSETYNWSDLSTNNETTLYSAGVHWVEISNYCGVAKDSIEFSVSPIPFVDLGIDTILCGDFKLPLDAGNPGMLYSWMPTGETTQKIEAEEQTTYTVIVTNKDGCEGTDDFRIGTECISRFHIPSSFSPNADGINDVFKPTLVNFQDYSLGIFNRWGEQLFISTDVNKGWDGTYNGALVPEGVYLYTIRFITTENGEFQNINGLLHIIR